MAKTINRLKFPEKFQLAEAIKHKYVESGLNDAQFAEYFNSTNSFKVTKIHVQSIRYSLRLVEPNSREALEKRIRLLEEKINNLLTKKD